MGFAHTILYFLPHYRLRFFLGSFSRSIKDFFNEFSVDLVTFTEGILNEKLHFLCSDCSMIKPHELVCSFSSLVLHFSIMGTAQSTS